MTREEAIAIFRGFKFLPREMEAVDMAIKALEQEPCEDCISRQAALVGLASIAKAKAKSDAQKSLMGRVMFFTERLPSVTPQQKAGKPIYDKTYHTYQCPNCRKIIGKTINFCPYCGAKMRESEEEE